MRIWFRIEIGMSMMALTNEYWNKAKLSKQMKKEPNTRKSRAYKILIIKKDDNRTLHIDQRRVHPNRRT